MHNIIIRVPNFIGDSVNTTPAIELLKAEYPEAKITIMGPEFVKDIFKHDKRITRFITTRDKSFWRAVLEIRKEKYDLGVIFVNTLISAIMFRFGRIRTIIGYNNEQRGILIDYAPKLNRNSHYINRYAQLVNKFLNEKYQYLPPLSIKYTKEKTFEFNNSLKTIGLYLGGPNKKFRSYPVENSIELINKLTDYNIVLIGDKNDNIYHAKYLEETQHPSAINLTGKTTVEELINTIYNLDLLITIDSAAMHIAAAVGTRFIGLFGLSTSPVSAILPKVDFGEAIRIENNLIKEEDFIKNITPDIVLKHIHLRLSS